MSSTVLITALTTARLDLHTLAPQDAAILQDFLLANRTHLAPWEPAREESFFSIEQCQQRLTGNWLSMESGQALYLAIFKQNEARMIGACNFNNIVRGIFQAGHLGYAIAAEHEGQGYMQEALQAAIRHMFEQQGLHRIMANHLPENTRSAAVLQRLGFEREGLAKSYLKINGVWRDHVLNSLVNPRN
ncbi:GNAT family N-acetyltransferase [Undibacterium sp. Jales W-56]|uniref:GNAT family N-acetyltransferase n=1 Tax=Undibacterium sp. Jales W-56 TaxID=2897325 RepID=UPI0021CEF816|nr:GNAT family N-acetyltransferase [Undibacterium sp. Jales W-56]MCU6432425.1 GNAT family N-acetyltransferase [Undibacterium sp. Jales W-56]